jgi:acyl dehydratase
VIGEGRGSSGVETGGERLETMEGSVHMAKRRSVEESYGGTVDLRSAKVGDRVGALPFVVTEEMVQRNAWANDDYHPWYLDGSPFGGRIVSPVFLASFDAHLFYGYYAYPEGGALFAKQEFEYLKPLLVGEPYVMSGEVVEIYERKGRTFYRLAISVTDNSGEEHMRMVKTIAAPVTPDGTEQTT